MAPVELRELLVYENVANQFKFGDIINYLGESPPRQWRVVSIHSSRTQTSVISQRVV